MPPGPVGNANLGMVRPLSRAGGANLRPQLDALFRAVLEVGDAARGWFDGPGLAWRASQPPAVALATAIESLGVSARLLAVMNWLLDPANGGNPTSLVPLNHDDPPPLPPDHPLAATPGGAIAAASRQVLARAQALSALHARPSESTP